MTRRLLLIRRVLLGTALALVSSFAFAGLPETIEKIKPSIVAIGTYKKTQSPPFVFRGTGFAIGNGSLIATNAHVLPELSLPDGPELAVLIPSSGTSASVRRARVTGRAPEHDLAVIQIEGPPLTPLSLAEANSLGEGQEIAFTGFPIGGALGFTPVTHRGIVSAKTPIAIPGNQARQLNEVSIRRLRTNPFMVYQLDATAYPGNSGSPVFDSSTGHVHAVINMVFVKGSKEHALSQPSGITYAIPVHHLIRLLKDGNGQASP